jgi:dihydrofolate reductase
VQNQSALEAARPTTEEAQMGRLILDISMSLDGFVAGPNPTSKDPLGEGGTQLHEWAFATRAWRESHGLEGGEDNVDSKLVEDLLANVGATVMGRRMYSGNEGPWADDANADGWWGDEPPFHHPVFVLTHHERRPVTMQGGTSFTFVTDGIEAALEQAQRAAGEQDVRVAGGANAAQQYLRAGLLDELQLHVAPVLLGDGVRLFEGGLLEPPAQLECTGAARSPTGVAHLTYRAGG